MSFKFKIFFLLFHLFYYLSHAQAVGVSYCPGSNTAIITAPSGFTTYSWTSPPGFQLGTGQSTLSSISITNALAGNVYTVVMNAASANSLISTYTLSPTSVSISSISSLSTCVGGAFGSATVQGMGSGNGYNYIWLNSSNSVIATTSVVSSLLPGIYTASLSAINSSLCGSSVASVTISATQNLIQQLVPFCTGLALLTAPNGSNFQWYNGSLTIPSNQGGAAPNYTVANPVNLGVYGLGFLSTQGCRDSIRFTLVASNPGIMSVSYNKTVCTGATDGEVVISLTPAIGAPTGNNFYIFNSYGATLPMTSSVVSTSNLSFSVTGLFQGGTYSVQVFDGRCLYSTTITPNTLPAYNYTLTPGNSTLCQGNSILLSCMFSLTPVQNQYTYSWSPSTFIAGPINNVQSIILVPIVPTGGSVTTIYTVVVTPTLANCPLSKTISITMFNPVSPTLTPITSTFCSNSPQYTIQVTPAGGQFSTGLSSGASPVGSINGVITPSLANLGINSFTYGIYTSTCLAQVSGTYVMNGPILTSVGNTTICSGNSTTLNVSGASQYLWNGSSTGSTYVINPTTTTAFTVIGTNTVNNCSAIKIITVQVLSLPTIPIAGNSYTVCSSSQSTVSINGNDQYYWSIGSTGNSAVFYPSHAGTQSVIAINPNTGCSNTAVFYLVPKVSPTLYINGNLNLCYGQNSQLSATGANTYTWSNGIKNSVTSFTTGLSNISFTVIGIDTTNGCKNFASVTISVTSCDYMVENKISTVKVYPNPTFEKITIESTENNLIQLINQFGTMVYSTDIHSGVNHIDLKELPCGFYFLIYHSTYGVKAYRIVKTGNY